MSRRIRLAAHSGDLGVPSTRMVPLSARTVEPELVPLTPQSPPTLKRVKQQLVDDIRHLAAHAARVNPLTLGHAYRDPSSEDLRPLAFSLILQQPRCYPDSHHARRAPVDTGSQAPQPALRSPVRGRGRSGRPLHRRSASPRCLVPPAGERRELSPAASPE